MVHAQIVGKKFTEYTTMPNNTVYKSHLADGWFQSPTGEDLANYITNKTKEFQQDTLNSENLKNVNKKIGAILAPHAGYAYSLDTAIKAYMHLNKDNYDRVLLLSPSHRYPLFEKCAIEPISRIETACGDISFDKDFAESLKELNLHIIEEPQASMQEHSIHIQLPLIRHFLGDIPVAALMVGQFNYDKELESFASELYETLNSLSGGIERTLIIISTDFTHFGQNFNYYPFAYDEQTQENLNSLDHTVYHAFASQDIALFEKVMHKTKATVCGANAMKLLMTLLPDNCTFEEIFYTTSGELLKDFSSSVSYLSALVYIDWSKGFKTRLENDNSGSRFTREERRMIVDIAKKSLYYSVEHGKAPQVDYETIPPKLKEDGAVFVTLEKHGNLRGCIGDIVPTRPLVDSIIQRAFSAALEDYRFEKVTLDELSQIDLEVSVLSPPMPIPSYNDIIIGKHGVILQKSKNSAVFLPQVAPEQGWNLEEMLSHLAMKAGLEANAWKEDCIYYVFTAEIMH